MKPDWFEGLTPKQITFCEEYSSNGGHGSNAAEAAGYGNPGVASTRNLKKEKIRKALVALNAPKRKNGILTKEERQRIWSDIANDTSEKTQDRLKATELLGRSQGDFLDRVVVSFEDEVKAMDDDVLEAEYTKIIESAVPLLPGKNNVEH